MKKQNSNLSPIEETFEVESLKKAEEKALEELKKFQEKIQKGEEVDVDDLD